MTASGARLIRDCMRGRWARPIRGRAASVGIQIGRSDGQYLSARLLTRCGLLAAVPCLSEPGSVRRADQACPSLLSAYRLPAPGVRCVNDRTGHTGVGIFHVVSRLCQGTRRQGQVRRQAGDGGRSSLRRHAPSSASPQRSDSARLMAGNPLRQQPARAAQNGARRGRLLVHAAVSPRLIQWGILHAAGSMVKMAETLETNPYAILGAGSPESEAYARAAGAKDWSLADKIRGWQHGQNGRTPETNPYILGAGSLESSVRPGGRPGDWSLADKTYLALKICDLLVVPLHAVHGESGARVHRGPRLLMHPGPERYTAG